MSDKSLITVMLTRAEARALERAVEVGVRVIEALDLARQTTATETARAKLLRAAISRASRHAAQIRSRMSACIP